MYKKFGLKAELFLCFDNDYLRISFLKLRAPLPS